MSSLNQSTFRWLRNEIASASMRTQLDIAARGVSIRLTGRCSPYLSHRMVDFAPCDHANATWIAFRDPEEGVAIYPTPMSLDAERDWPEMIRESAEEDWGTEHIAVTVLRLPAVLLGPLVSLEDETGGMVTIPQTGFACVAIARRRVIGWRPEVGADGLERMRPILSGLEPEEAQNVVEAAGAGA